MRTKAALFLVEYLQASFNTGLNFVSYFYSPSWSILFWLLRTCSGTDRFTPKQVRDAKTGHTMAMFLHALDDHLNDRQLPVTHLALLMRSQSWMLMNHSFRRLAFGLEDGASLVDDLINDYYSSIDSSGEAQSLDSYCQCFVKQMATWLIVPILLARRLCADEDYSRAIQSAYSSFGIAWRLLDDLQDFEKDMVNGIHSAIYVCLNKDLRYLWDHSPVERKGPTNRSIQMILRYVHENKVIDTIMKRACDELASAASTADACGMPGLAVEFRSLVKPLRIGLS
jgi:hypothetical protein